MRPEADEELVEGVLAEGFASVQIQRDEAARVPLIGESAENLRDVINGERQAT